tara:strand:- start:60741 stop:62027 length:1287 start_codon:yes stop_codon:yes gene_type:complete
VAFTKADGSAGSLRDDGKIADQNYKGVMSAGGASVGGDLFDVKSSAGSGRLPRTPVPSGSGKVGSSPYGAYNVLDGGTIAYLGGAEWNSKIGDVSPGANSSNSFYPLAVTNRTNNYKELTSAGNWNIFKGEWEAGDSFRQSAGGAWSSTDQEDQANDMRSAATDAAAYNPSAPMVISENATPVAFVSEIAPYGQTTKCNCDPRSNQDGTPIVKGPKWPDACDPKRGMFGDFNHPFCTGTRTKNLETKGRKNCKIWERLPSRVYLGYYWGFRNVPRSSGRCALIAASTASDIGPTWDNATRRWHYQAGGGPGSSVGSTTNTEGSFGISGDPGYTPDCKFYCGCKPGMAGRDICGGWRYKVRAIDETGGFIVHPKESILEREFHPVIDMLKTCPGFTVGLYVAAASTLSPPKYTGYDCGAVTRSARPQPF